MDIIYLIALQGLLRRTSPVVCIITESQWLENYAAYPGYHVPGIAFTACQGTEGPVSFVKFDHRTGGLLQMSQSWLGLVLNDPTGRMHAIWWLLEQDLDAINYAMKKILGSTNLNHWISVWSNPDNIPEHYIRYLRAVCLEVARVFDGN